MSNATMCEKRRLLHEDAGIRPAGRDRLLYALYPPTSAQRARARLDLIVDIDRRAQAAADWLGVSLAQLDQDLARGLGVTMVPRHPDYL